MVEADVDLPRYSVGMLHLTDSSLQSTTEDMKSHSEWLKSATDCNVVELASGQHDGADLGGPVHCPVDETQSDGPSMLAQNATRTKAGFMR